MKYDIFISYSHKDYYKDDGRTIIPGSVVSQIVEVLDKYKKYYDFEYFFDQEAITSRQDYLKRISAAIGESEVMFFVASKNSYEAEFCTKELLFADKRDVRIHQYRIDDAVMPDDIDMLLGNHHYREYKTYSVEKMVCEVLSDALKCDIKPIKEITSNDSIAVKDAAAKTESPRSSKTYKVGDLYDENGKRGVVFEVSADGKHGKIVSLVGSDKKLQWASDTFESWNTTVLADKEYNGRANNWWVKHIPDWQNKYPAFAWCVALGEDWYLPSRWELQTISKHRHILNRRLKEKIEDGVYWTSTEIDGFHAWYVIIQSGYGAGFYKYGRCYVRAVATF